MCRGNDRVYFVVIINFTQLGIVFQLEISVVIMRLTWGDGYNFGL